MTRNEGVPGSSPGVGFLEFAGILVFARTLVRELELRVVAELGLAERIAKTRPCRKVAPGTLTAYSST
jgi:hypothetical protein